MQANCYVVFDPDTKEAVIIDIGDASDEVLKTVAANKLRVTKILATHAHFDHVYGVGWAKQ